jgi:Tfp pilus assembly protein PilF
VLDPLFRAAQAQPESASAHYELARMFYYMDQGDFMWSELTNALLLDPEDDRAHFLLGLLREWYKTPFGKEYRRFDPLYNRTYLDDAPRQLAYGQDLLVRDFRNKGLQILTDAVKRYPQDARAHQALAGAMFITGNGAAAASESELALRLAPDSKGIADQLRTILLSQQRDPAEIELRIREIQSHASQPRR